MGTKCESGVVQKALIISITNSNQSKFSFMIGTDT